MSSPVWRKSRRSGAQEGNCVELAELPGAVGVRDSKNTGAGHLVLSIDVFSVLVGRIKAGELEL